MVLKSRQWFQGKCHREVRSNGSLAKLANRAMELGPINTDNTTGHMLQAIGAVQEFFDAYPWHLKTVNDAPFESPFALRGQILEDWKTFFSAHQGTYGNQKWGYNWDTLRNILTIKYGGKTTGGGGADNEFEIVFRLIAGFI